MKIPTDKSTFLIQSSKNQSFGTGVVVKKDEHGSYLVTCTHVVEQCQEEFLEVANLKAELLRKGSSSDIDLAVLYVKGLTNTKALALCSNNVDENVLFEINGFKPYKRESFKFEKLDGAIKKISEIHTHATSITTYELSLEKEDNIEKGYSGSAVLLQGTNSIIAIATDRNQNGKDAYAIPIAYLKETWEEMPELVASKNRMNYKGIEKVSFLKKMENLALNNIIGVIVMAVLTGFIYDYLKPKDTTEETVKIEAKKTNTNLEEIKALIKLQGGDETAFLEKYFGKDYKQIVENPQTYHNFTTLLKNTTKTPNELLEEREKLLKKIQAQSLKSSIQKLVDQAFQELRYEDVRTLLDEFIVNNQAIGDDLIKAHFQKALSYIEELEYHKAKVEFEEFIPMGIKDAEILNEYGLLYDTLGEYDKSIEFYNKALKIQFATLGENHPSTATTYNNIGSAWHSKGENDEAIYFYNKSLKITLATLGEQHPSVATSYNNIGGIWNDKGEYLQAIKFHLKSLEIRLTTLEKNHPHIATSYNNIAEALRGIGKYEEAIDLYTKSLKIHLVTLGEKHPFRATSYNNIGLAWSDKGEYDKAIDFFNRALQIRLDILGKNHHETAGSYNSLGLAWKRKEEYNKAIEFYNKSLKIRLNTLGKNHPATAISYNNIGSLFESKGEYQKAIKFYNRALRILIDEWGKNHPTVTGIQGNLKRTQLKAQEK